MTQRVLDWRNRRAWLSAIRVYAGNLLTPEIRTTLEIRRPECWSDVMNWLPDHERLLAAFTDQMSSYYSHLKAFHGCRPESLATYHELGLQGQRPERIIETFRSIFSDVPRQDVDSAIQKMQHRGAAERGRIWLSADDEEMVRDFGHYMIHGSEYLLALAAHLGTGVYCDEDYRQRLKNFGIPTVLEVDVPIEMFSKVERRALARCILSEWGQLRARRPLRMSSTPCYVVQHDIPAQCIKSHYHPPRIRDVHCSSTMYYSKQLHCEQCAPLINLPPESSMTS